MSSKERSSLAISKDREASRMFCLWICLVYALQSRVSTDQEVSLHCSDTVNVTQGQSVTLNCTINWKHPLNCTVKNYYWRNTNDTKQCDNMTKFISNWNCSKYMSLTILNAQEEEYVTAEIQSDCGMDKSHPIKVQLVRDEHAALPPRHTVKYRQTNVTTIVLVVFVSAVVAVILYFLYNVKKKTVSYTALGHKDSVDA